MNSFREIVYKAAWRYARGPVEWSEAATRKTRGGRYYSEHHSRECKDAILRRAGKKSWDITLPSGFTFRKQEGSHGFKLGAKCKPITERSHKILLRKRTAHPSATA